MLDSSKEINSFNPRDHFEQICKSIEITSIQYSEVNYQQGWANLVSGLLNDLKIHEIETISIEDTFGQLDIDFKLNHLKGELAIWRLINNYKHKSRTICMKCGDERHRIYLVSPNKRLCRECQKLAGKNGNTGTWLDKYN